MDAVVIMYDEGPVLVLHFFLFFLYSYYHIVGLIACFNSADLIYIQSSCNNDIPVLSFFFCPQICCHQKQLSTATREAITMRIFISESLKRRKWERGCQTYEFITSTRLLYIGN